MLAGEFIKFHCGVLNSRLIAWFMHRTAVNWGENVKWLKTSVDMIPIPKPTKSDNDSIIYLVDKIINAKTEDHGAQISGWEREIDRIVFSLFNLSSSEEDKIIELTRDYK